MNLSQFWRNFDLGEEVAIAGAFIFNGLRRFHEMQTLHHDDEVFEFLYSTSVGLERIIKVAVVLLEHDAAVDQEAFERSLVTHNHLDLLARVRARVQIPLSGVHNDMLSLLGTFYRESRYDRYVLVSKVRGHREAEAIRTFLTKHLKVSLDPDPLIPTRNLSRYRQHVATTICKIAREVYAVVSEKARERGLYTYELRSGSKAERVFLGEEPSFAHEDILWKELLVFFMNSEPSGGRWRFMKSIPPLSFDPALALDYLRCFRSPEAAADVMGELEVLYEEVEDPGERQEMMAAIDDDHLDFESDLGDGKDEEWDLDDEQRDHGPGGGA